MCKVGGPRCDGSHTPSTTQRARRKANAAYRKQLTTELETRVGDPHLAEQIRHASTTDLHEIAIVAGINPRDIALRCGSATYTSPTGETATVYVTPPGTTRRSPMSEETKLLLNDINDTIDFNQYETEDDGCDWTLAREAILEGGRDRLKEIETNVTDPLREEANKLLDPAKMETLSATGIQYNLDAVEDAAFDARYFLPYVDDDDVYALAGVEDKYSTVRDMLEEAKNHTLTDNNGTFKTDQYNTAVSHFASSNFHGDPVVKDVARKLDGGITSLHLSPMTEKTQKLARWAHQVKDDPIFSPEVRQLAKEFDAVQEYRRAGRFMSTDNFTHAERMRKLEDELNEGTFTHIADIDELKKQVKQLQVQGSLVDKTSTTYPMEPPRGMTNGEITVSSIMEREHTPANLMYAQHLDNLRDFRSDMREKIKQQDDAAVGSYMSLENRVARYRAAKEALNGLYEKTDNAETRRRAAQELEKYQRDVELAIDEDTDFSQLPEQFVPISKMDKYAARCLGFIPYYTENEPERVRQHFDLMKNPPYTADGTERKLYDRAAQVGFNDEASFIGSAQLVGFNRSTGDPTYMTISYCDNESHPVTIPREELEHPDYVRALLAKSVYGDEQGEPALNKETYQHSKDFISDKMATSGDRAYRDAYPMWGTDFSQAYGTARERRRVLENMARISSDMKDAGVNRAYHRAMCADLVAYAWNELPTNPDKRRKAIAAYTPEVRELIAWADPSLSDYLSEFD